MTYILPVHGITPKFGEKCFLADNSTITGDVVMGDQCSVWFNAVIRGDVNSVRIGDRVNVQDGAIIHCTYQKAKTNIGNDVNIGHNAIVHGCTLENNVLIGMGAIVMDHAVVESFSIVAAGAVVLEKTRVESGFIYAGNPARKIKAISEEQRKLLEELSSRYVMYSGWYSKD
ncbi:MAG: gamma carbonic anhydrase family protein [Bacteroidetes bacterium]|nr:MAG: gamma carbonic anhydrase family protein [Bacteroidota bacterium]REK03441.1 MAG: gamma carbonic anhydrase family protein [Bacteroidota bacterium]REK34447.1 MAG: gamma carbonic anhydrase family protein [Bacteroidota bacterium]REK50435.1 MAG: gamma carbonic anhydrase family protein [Bacteroidota bacterium]